MTAQAAISTQDFNKFKGNSFASISDIEPRIEGPERAEDLLRNSFSRLQKKIGIKEGRE